jgi:hypothetical protein
MRAFFYNPETFHSLVHEFTFHIQAASAASIRNTFHNLLGRRVSKR